MTEVYVPGGTDESTAAAYSAVVRPFPLAPVTGPVESLARVTEVVFVGHPYFAPPEPPRFVVEAAVPQVLVFTSAPHAWIPNQGVVAGKTAGVVESATANPVASSIKCPEAVAVKLYPLNALVATVMSWAEIFGSVPEETGREPKFTAVAVEVTPLFVTSVFVQPVAFPKLAAAPFAIPAIVKVRVESTVA